MAKKWYLPRSKIWTNKTEAKRIQKDLKKKGYKSVTLHKRQSGFWIKKEE